MSFISDNLQKIFPNSTKQIINETIKNEAPKIAQEMAKAMSADIVADAIPKIKAMAGITRGYGYQGGTDGSKYRGGISGTGSGVFFDHRTIRQNARKACFDSPQGKALVDRFADFAVGPGVKLESTPMASVLGMTDEEAEVWGKKVEEKFHLYCTDKKAHRSGNITLYQAHRLYMIEQQRDNDNFVRLYYSKNKRLQNPLQFEFLDADQIRGFSYTTSTGFNAQVDGIIRNADGTAKAYKVWIQDPKNPGAIKDVEIPALSTDGRRIMMIHGYIAEYAGQGRGYSRLTHVLQDLQNLEDFSLSNILTAISQSQFALFVKPSKDADASDPMAGLVDSGVGPSVVETTETLEPTALPNDGLVGVCNLPEANTDKPGGGVLVNLHAGEDLKVLQKAPSQDYDKFIDAYMSYVSASSSMPIEMLKMKFGQNYSASRATLLLFWTVLDVLRGELVSDFIQPIYEMWLSEEIAAGRITAPGFTDPVMRQAYLQAEYIGPSLPNIDPKRSAEAVTEQLKYGGTNLRRAAQDQTGTNFASNARKNAVDFGKLTPLPFEQNPNKEQPQDD